MNKSPAALMARPKGPLSSAEVAGPPSPEYPEVPLPAKVLMIPDGVTSRMTVLPASDINISPFESNATPSGSWSCASVAGPPLPVEPDSPSPATVLTIPDSATPDDALA